jgi:hypothetical protein
MNKKKEYYAEKRRKKKVELIYENIPEYVTVKMYTYWVKKYFDCTGLGNTRTCGITTDKIYTKQQAQERLISRFAELKGRELK